MWYKFTYVAGKFTVVTIRINRFEVLLPIVVVTIKNIVLLNNSLSRFVDRYRRSGSTWYLRLMGIAILKSTVF